MNAGKTRGDVVLLVADKDIEAGFRALLNRPEAFGIKRVKFDIYPHRRHDPGVFKHAADFLRIFTSDFKHAIAVFDREGCGSEDDADTLARRVETDLTRSGWEGRAKAIVLDPELEVWIWGDSPHVASVLGWEGSSVRAMLNDIGHLPDTGVKPDRPKEAMEAALRRKGVPKSSSLYKQLAEKVSLRRCSDPAFGRFKSILQEWFPLQS